MRVDPLLAEHAHLWQEDAKDHVIVSWRHRNLRHSVIFNIKHRAVILIEDDDVVAKVIEKMLAHGVPVVDEVPPIT